MKKLKVIVVCEESQAICKAFRELEYLGYEAYSCDLQECSGGYPEWHLQMDCFEAIKMMKWDLMIGHPPCTFMSKAGARWMYPTAGNIDEDRLQKAIEAKKFFMKLLNYSIPCIALENPTPLKIVGLPKHTQVIQPYQYGHEYSKRTLLWLKNLPPLRPTNILTEYTPYLPSNTGGKKRGQSFNRGIAKNAKESSKTFYGIATAMAQQWGKYLT